MKKYILLSVLLFLISIYNINVTAEDTIDNLIIEGLDKIQTEYEAGTSPNTINFVKGLSLYSNKGTLAPDKLMVDYLEVDFNRVGNYNIYYYVIFVLDNNEVRYEVATLPIQIVDHTKPTLLGVKPIYVNQNTKDPIDYLQGVQATDNDQSSPLDIKVFNQSVDTTKVGIYTVSYYVVDKSGNDTMNSTFLVVQNGKNDPNKPEITVDRLEFNIMKNQHNPEETYLSSVRVTDGLVDLTQYIQFDDSGVDYTTLGSYEIVFMIFDNDGNFAKEVIPVNIVEDNEAPYFIDLGDTYDLTINTLDLKKGINAFDDVCGDMTSNIKVTIGTDFQFDVEGYYDVVYSVSDYNGNEISKNVTVHIYDNVQPSITSPNSLYLKINEKLDLSNKITVSDNYDPNVNYLLKENDLDATTVGTYIIEIVATDQTGNEAIKKITIHVYDPEIKEFYENPIVLGTLVAIGVSGSITLIGYTMSKKRRRRR